MAVFHFSVNVRDLKNIKSAARPPLPPFATGQIWQMQNSRLQIGTIGKTLVHYKHFRGTTVRSPVSLTGRASLEKFLIENNAVLIDPKAKVQSP